MKYLSNYMEAAQTALFDETGAFFAFSQKQFNEAAKEGNTYTNLGSGMFCPSDKVDRLITGLETIYKDGIKQDIEENGIDAIIARELGNHECFYTGSFSDAADALVDYGITREQVKAKFYQMLNLKNDEL